MSIKGLDVSEFQGEVDWERVKAAGYKFAMLRAGYGYNTIDKQFRRNASECNRIGLPVGVYWFCYAFSPEKAVQEADGCIDIISEYRLDYPVCYDIEQASADYIEKQGVSFTPALAKNVVKSFCDRIEAKGYYAMFYTNRNFLDTYLGTELSKRYAYWYARYADRFDGTDCGIWQYTSTGSVPGITGNVDLDLGYTDYPSVIKKAGLNHLSASSPFPSPVPEYITYVIQPGDTLSGIARRYGTTVTALTQLNKLSDPDKIYAGNTLKVPENGTGVDSSTQYYTIQPGDTLSEIARRFGTTVSALTRLNGISDPDKIYAGNRIRIK
ncbi:MAG TPA: LysM peptidoglycan-binding domain-containing protein [Candidatus Mediterraneibacter intestinigallinarum]|nr:LysM peptidoglycan-binding domain-containing protein [Candidatus Mediterraneibacter intestinigallinarum]